MNHVNLILSDVRTIIFKLIVRYILFTYGIIKSVFSRYIFKKTLNFVELENDARSPRTDATHNKILSLIVLQSGSKGKSENTIINYGRLISRRDEDVTIN